MWELDSVKKRISSIQNTRFMSYKQSSLILKAKANMIDGVSVESDKVLQIIAGPNASGKSSVLSIISADNYLPKKFLSVNGIVKEKRYQSISDERQRYVQAINVLEERFYDLTYRGISLTLETVLSTEGKLDFIDYAKSMGYKVHSIYLSVDDPELLVDRVGKRILDGGPEISVSKVLSRYSRSMEFLPELWKLSDVCEVYDTDGSSELMALKMNEDSFLFNKEIRPAWVFSRLEAPLLLMANDLSVKDLTVLETEEFLKVPDLPSLGMKSMKLF